MLTYPAALAKKIEGIFRAGKRKSRDGVEVAREILAVEPAYGPAFLLMGMAREASGDLDGAAAAYWKALALCPCRPDCYLYLANVHLRRGFDPDDPVILRLNEIAFWKLSMAEKVRPEVVGLMGPVLKDAGSPSNPMTYRRLAEAVEQECNLPVPIEDDELLARYKLLNDLQRQAWGMIDPKVLRKVLDHPEEYAALIHAALREWANTEPRYRTLSEPAMQIFVAILGEIGSAEAIGDLLELADDADETTFRHVHWALHRLGARHPGEAVETMRSATRGAESGMLCALAEQLNLLPAAEGVVPALAALMEEFPRVAKEDDAAYLLALVTDAMVERGAVDEAHAVLSRCQAMLDRKTREWLDETINSDEEFVSNLAELGILGFSIEEVCVELALIDEDVEEEGSWEDGDFGDVEDVDDFEEEEDVEEFEDFELKPVFSPRVVRNDPCWCGSGKKYKKCHLREDEEAHYSGAKPAASPAASLPLRIMKGGDRWHSMADRARASEMFFGSAAGAEHDEVELAAMAEFMAHDFRDAATGLTLIEHYLKDNGSRLTAEERAVVESMRDARFGLYEIFKLEKGGLHLRDVFDGETYFVESFLASRTCAKGDYTLTRVQLLDGRYLLPGDGTPMTRDFLDAMKEFIAKGSLAAGQTEAEFVRANSHRVRRYLLGLRARAMEEQEIVDEDDEVLEACSANYLVLDRPVLLAKLRALDDVYEEESEDSTACFGWLEVGEEDREINGTFRVSKRSLLLETSSRLHLRLGREMLEHNAGRLLKFLDQRRELDEFLKPKAGGRTLDLRNLRREVGLEDD